MSRTMLLAVPTALRATYDQLATLSSAVAQRYVEVAPVVQPRSRPQSLPSGPGTVCN